MATEWPGTMQSRASWSAGPWGLQSWRGVKEKLEGVSVVWGGPGSCGSPMLQFVDPYREEVLQIRGFLNQGLTLGMLRSMETARSWGGDKSAMGRMQPGCSRVGG